MFYLKKMVLGHFTYSKTLKNLIRIKCLTQISDSLFIRQMIMGRFGYFSWFTICSSETTQASKFSIFRTSPKGSIPIFSVYEKSVASVY